MSRIIKGITVLLLLLLPLTLSGCLEPGEQYVELKGVEYTSVINQKPSALVVADSGRSSITYTYPGCDINFGSLAERNEEEEGKKPQFDVSLSTKTQAVGDCVFTGDQYSITYSKCLMSVIFEGEDREAFLEYAKEDCTLAASQRVISRAQLRQYLALLDGKIIDIYKDSVEKLVVSGTVNRSNKTMSMDSLSQYDAEGALWQVSKYNSDGVIVFKERYNEAGVVVGAFEYYNDGQSKSLTWYYDDGSFMNSEEYTVENGVKTKAVFKSKDGNVGIEYFKNGIIFRAENTDPRGIQTWVEYDEQGNESKFTVNTGDSEDFYRIGLFVVNPKNGEPAELESTTYAWDGSVLDRSECTYDENYNLTCVKCYDASGVLETEERFDARGRSTYWYSLWEQVICISRYDGADYDRYVEEYTLDNVLSGVFKEKDGQVVYSKYLRSDGTWVEEFR